MVLVGFDWFWPVLVGFSMVSATVLVRFGWFWLALAGFGSFLPVLVDFGRFWLVLVGWFWLVFQYVLAVSVFGVIMSTRAIK